MTRQRPFASLRVTGFLLLYCQKSTLRALCLCGEKFGKFLFTDC
jgi:hypothetical protein